MSALTALATRRLRWRLLLATALIAGCASVSREAPDAPDLRLQILADSRYSLEHVPAGAPPQRAASFRIAEKGLRAIRDGRWQEAEDRLEKALSLDPGNPFCYFYLAEIRNEAGQSEQALLLLNQAEVLFQGHPYWLAETYAHKGRILESLRATGEARQAYAEALEFNPWHEEARNGLTRTGGGEG